MTKIKIFKIILLMAYHDLQSLDAHGIYDASSHPSEQMTLGRWDIYMASLQCVLKAIKTGKKCFIFSSD